MAHCSEVPHAGVPDYSTFPSAYWAPSPTISYCSNLTPSTLSNGTYGPSPALSLADASPFTSAISHPDISAPQEGLGISARFPSEVRDYYSSPMGNSYQMMAQEASPSQRAYKRTKRLSSGSSCDTTPVHIQPHPDGVRNMMMPKAVNIHPKPRAPGRGRRDPQAEEEDALVESLREQGVAWKIVRLRFQETFKKDATEARLQMRLLRRQRDQATRWNLSDASYLEEAYRHWKKEKYRLIQAKMIELGGSSTYSPEQCKEQLRLSKTKDQRRSRSSGSPSSSLSDSGQTPTTPVHHNTPATTPMSMSRKRRAESELDFGIGESLF